MSEAPSPHAGVHRERGGGGALNCPTQQGSKDTKRRLSNSVCLFVRYKTTVSGRIFAASLEVHSAQDATGGQGGQTCWPVCRALRAMSRPRPPSGRGREVGGSSFLPFDPAADAGWVHQRELRSTVTMMRYLSRPSSQQSSSRGPTAVLQPVHRVAERRAGPKTLRVQQNCMEAQLQTRVQRMAVALEAGAAARSHAKAVAEAAWKQVTDAAENAARVMGAVAPHRQSARDAALAVVAPSEARKSMQPARAAWSPERPIGSPNRTARDAAEPSIAAFFNPAGASPRPLQLLPHRRYLLRSCVYGGGASARPTEETYVVYAPSRPKPETLHRVRSPAELLPPPASCHYPPAATSSLLRHPTLPSLAAPPASHRQTARLPSQPLC